MFLKLWHCCKYCETLYCSIVFIDEKKPIQIKKKTSIRDIEHKVSAMSLNILMINTIN